ncbi:MAG TPA: L-aspartate oxidase [Methyloceanibacter sp.]
MTNRRKQKTPSAPAIERRGVVIVGAGLAGLFTALKLAPIPVTLVSGARLGEGASSVWAQAGIAAALAEGDSPEAHAADTIGAGAGIVDETIALTMAREARERIEDLLRYGVPFDKDLEGRLDLAQEAAHGKRRILHVKGDTAGRAIMAALIEAARNTPSIEILEGCAACGLVTGKDRVAGVELAPVDATPLVPTLVLEASAIVLATGGAGQLYAITTNPRESRGEGIAIAAGAGAVIADAEFVQFHPTAIDIGRDPAPLATEALRGEGATLVNGRGERFMRQVHADAELAPRDIVTRAVQREIATERGAYLDCRKLGPHFVESFPTVNAACREAGIDPTKEPIPIAPAAHYHMGGVLTDRSGRTTLPGLWACGEVASTGAHGANRLASNSLLEAVVFGTRVANDITRVLPLSVRNKHDFKPLAIAYHRAPQRADDTAAVKSLRRTMTNNVGVIRDADSLLTALRTIAALEAEAGEDRRFANMLIAAKLIAASALQRRESRGAHFRTDYPVADPRLAKRSHITLDEADSIMKAAMGKSRKSAPSLAALHA